MTTVLAPGQRPPPPTATGAVTTPSHAGSTLPPPLRSWRRAAARQRFMHHNRLAALVFAANLVTLASAALWGGWWVGQAKLSALSAMVIVNLAGSTLIRQQYVINLLFWLATRAPVTWPLRVRRVLGKVYHFGGLHVGGTVSATVWFLLLATTITAEKVTSSSDISIAYLVLTYAICVLLLGMIVCALPGSRARHHDAFERTHRFGGWAALSLLWMHVGTGAAAADGAFVRTPTCWVLIVVTASIALPWLRLRRVPVEIARPSSHVAVVKFDYGVTPFAGSSTAISRNPLLEWHSFANVPSPNQHGFRLTISRSGDWTAGLIDELPSHVWVKGIPTAGVGNVDRLFRRVVWVATGSGIGPCLPHLLSGEVPARLVWSTRHPRATFGDALVDEILDVQPDAIIWDTDSRGKPDLLQLAFDAVAEFDAEAVICISNKKTTWQIVEQLELRGIPAYGAIWDS